MTNGKFSEEDNSFEPLYNVTYRVIRGSIRMSLKKALFPECDYPLMINTKKNKR